MSVQAVSVVMAVFHEPAQVRRTIDSVLAQTGVELELLLVSDGADESVLKVLTGYRSDTRVRVIEQKHKGLTQALIVGCSQASHEFIARIDTGDLMVANRLAEQAAALAANKNTGLVTSWVEIVTQEGYHLYDMKASQAELNAGLRARQAAKFRSPVHASVMFRKSLYEQVGGYRSEFYYTQDCDLWSRMILSATLVVIEKCLTIAIYSVRGISAQHVLEQRQLVALVAKANDLRARQRPDESVLEEAVRIRPMKQVETNVESDNYFDGYYFLAKVLSKNRSPHAQYYWRKAINAKPWSFRARIFATLNKYFGA